MQPANQFHPGPDNWMCLEIFVPHHAVDERPQCRLVYVQSFWFARIRFGVLLEQRATLPDGLTLLDFEILGQESPESASSPVAESCPLESGAVADREPKAEPFQRQ